MHCVMQHYRAEYGILEEMGLIEQPLRPTLLRRGLHSARAGLKHAHLSHTHTEIARLLSTGNVSNIAVSSPALSFMGGAASPHICKLGSRNGATNNGARSGRGY